MAHSITCLDLTLLAVIARVNPYVNRVVVNDDSTISAYVGTDSDASELWWWFCEHMQHSPINLKIFSPNIEGDGYREYSETNFLTPTNHPVDSERMEHHEG